MHASQNEHINEQIISNTLNLHNETKNMTSQTLIPHTSIKAYTRQKCYDHTVNLMPAKNIAWNKDHPFGSLEHTKGTTVAIRQVSSRQSIVHCAINSNKGPKLELTRNIAKQDMSVMTVTSTFSPNYIAWQMNPDQTHQCNITQNKKNNPL